MTKDDPFGLFEAIYATRALRRLRPDPVPDDVLFQLIDAAIRAPSGQNSQDCSVTWPFAEQQPNDGWQHKWVQEA